MNANICAHSLGMLNVIRSSSVTKVSTLFLDTMTEFSPKIACKLATSSSRFPVSITIWTRKYNNSRSTCTPIAIMSLEITFESVNSNLPTASVCTYTYLFIYGTLWSSYMSHCRSDNNSLARCSAVWSSNLIQLSTLFSECYSYFPSLCVKHYGTIVQ